MTDKIPWGWHWSFEQQKRIFGPLNYPEITTGPDNKMVDPLFKPNDPFIATLKIQEIHRGRSAAGFIWVDQSGVEYYMFMKDTLELLKNPFVKIDGGSVHGTWKFVKRGSNYGICWINN